MAELWTARDLHFVRDYLGKLTIRQIALLLNRPPKQVYDAAYRNGYVLVRSGFADYKQQVQEMNAQGCSDHEIAEAIKVPRRTVSRWRRRLGLPSHSAFGRLSRRARIRSTKGVRRTHRENGFRSLREYALLQERIQALKMGWDQANTVREAQVLQFLYEVGQAGKKEIAARLGIKRGGFLNGILERLVKRNLLVKQHDTGCRVKFALAPEVTRHDPGWKKRKEEEEMLLGPQSVRERHSYRMVM